MSTTLHRASRCGRPLRVLHVIHGLDRGGLENGVINLVNHLSRSDFEQGICCLDHLGAMAERVSSDVTIDVLNRGRHDLGLPFRLARLIHQRRPDIIHCRNWNTWPDVAVTHLLTLRRSKLIWSFHGFADGDQFPVRRRLASRLLSMVTDHLFAVCRDSAKRYSTITGIPIGRFSVLYNGVNTQRFVPAANREQLREALGLGTDELLALTVASLTPIKDHTSLVQAIADLALPDDMKMRFLLIGEGPLRPQLEAQITRLSLQLRVILLGSCDHVADYLSVADFMILPSRLEGMSNAILEAMASGLPVIARNVGGNPEILLDGETGLLCRPDDVADLAVAIKSMLHDSEQRSRMGEAARQRAEKLFSIEAMLTAYAKYYRQAAGWA